MIETQDETAAHQIEETIDRGKRSDEAFEREIEHLNQIIADAKITPPPWWKD